MMPGVSSVAASSNLPGIPWPRNSSELFLSSTMASIIPEIRIYSPSDKGDDTSDSDRSRITGDASDRKSAMLFRGSREVFSGDSSNMVPWLNTFNMRPYNLSCLPSTMTYRPSCRSQSVAISRAKLGCITSSAKSLDVLRQNLQRSINREIDEILQRYLEKFFKPGLENVRINNGEHSISEQHIQAVCRQILEEAKKMYHGSYTRGNSPTSDYNIDSGRNSPSDLKLGRFFGKHAVTGRKRRDNSDSDSEASLQLVKKKKGRPPLHQSGVLSGRSTPCKLKADAVKREGPKWDPARLQPSSQFIMGAKANKALGLGATRGRLYIKHPEVFKYSGDQEDKQWLYEHNQMPATGGKAYMLLVEDIRELAETDEYRGSPGLMLDEIVGFSVPESMLAKMQAAMLAMRTDLPAGTRRRGARPSGDPRHDDGSASPAEEPLGTSPFGQGFEDVSPAASDVSATLEPPLTAPFELVLSP
ncbi:deoxynucleotidyltransferase terminal-interacting protein 1 [Dermacentor andersoni]|uniref:deoxynucleotidyltransferase terminal-interacting protein 1 n=1 Tax=Dermacentor andersoni TaxID=34620 RepID=UPI0021556870|nr:deoxynucleotidyltransferase terminal-interacting protein 1-like [Dermacentor andersoni]